MAKPCTPHLITRKGYATSVRQQSCQRLCNAQRVQLFKLQARNVNFLWEGVREGYLFFEKEIPLPYPHPLRGAGNGCSAAALPISLPLRENNQPGGQVMSRPART